MVRSSVTCALLVTVLLAASCTGSGSASSGTSPQTLSQPFSSDGSTGATSPDVRVVGTRFSGPNGRPVQLRGVAIHTLDPVVYRRAPELGVNFVRVAVPWSDYQPRPPQGEDPG